jgi:hypothetical protein
VPRRKSKEGLDNRHLDMLMKIGSRRLKEAQGGSRRLKEAQGGSRRLLRVAIRQGACRYDIADAIAEWQG